jgi:hypothetical protein
MIHATAILVAALLTAPAFADDPLPTLDEMLGLTESATGPSEEANSQLDDALSEREAGEAFQQAVSLMDQVAQRLTGDTNLGLDTQRMQEDIISKLDMVIESAQNNSNPSSGSSSSQSSQQDQPNQQQAQEEGSPDPSGEGEESSNPPGLQEGELSEAQAPIGAGWGNLPQRVRELLTQGLNDNYSELYRKLTEEYYRTLAEDEE